jgi:type IV pilus assembly protein PilP
MTAKKANRAIPILLVASLVLLSFAGCKKKQEPPAVASAPPANKPVATEQKMIQKPLSSAKAIPVVQVQVSSNKKAQSAQIDFSSKKDPFKPEIVELKQVPKGTVGDATLLNRNLLPIQRVEVDKFRVTGIIAGLKENRALIADPEGKAYVARAGMLIGPNNGKIIRISATAVEVEESFQDDNGRLKKRTVKLALQRKK